MRLAHVLSSLAAGFETPIANLTGILSFLLRMTADKMHSPRVIRRKYLGTSRARVSKTFLVYLDSMAHSGRSGSKDLVAFPAREVADFVGLHVSSEPSLGYECLATNIANIVLVVRVHVLVHTIKIYKVAKANLAGEVVLVFQFKRTDTIIKIVVERRVVSGN